MAKASAPPGETHSDLSHRSRQGCCFSLTERQKSPRDVFPQEPFHLNGPYFLGSQRLAGHARRCLFGLSAVASCASVNGRIHSSSSK